MRSNTEKIREENYMNPEVKFRLINEFKSNISKLEMSEKKCKQELSMLRENNYIQMMKTKRSFNETFTYLKQNLDVLASVPRKQNELLVFLMGAICTGKTAFTNLQFDLKRPTSSMSDDINKGELIFKTEKKMAIYEVTISASELDYCKDDLMRYKSLANAYKIFVFYEGAIKDHKNIILLASNICPRAKLYFVRSKADNFNQKQSRTLEKEKEIDAEMLKLWKVTDPKIYAVSSREKSSFQNQIVRKLIIEP